MPPCASLPFVFAIVTVLALAAAAAVAQTPVVSWSGETMRLRSASVTPSGGTTYAIALTMENDNANNGLPTSYRRWWHCQIGALNPAGTTLTVTVGNAGYSDTILPVWATSTDAGATFSAYGRMPTSAVPTQPTSSSHRFTIAVPAGVTAIRIAKYFPYTVTRKDAFVAGLAQHPRVRDVVQLGLSQQGRPIERIELTDVTVADAGKRRVWLHAGIHPAETTSYFVVEGLVAWLGSGDPWAEVLLDHAILDIVPMANPDGVWAGNYRTNVNSSNLENEWVAPYNSPEAEIVALRTAIENLMGTPAAPGSNPIDVLLNLHSSHNVTLPFHYRHTANANWNPNGNNSGVIPAVNALETDWITEFMAASPYVAQGSIFSSSAGAPQRPFVESMMHDRWSALSSWTGSPAFEDPVMAITFEGTYRYGPTSGVWNTEADYELVGAQLGRALAGYFDLSLSASVQPYGTPCHSLLLIGGLTPVANGHTATLSFAGAPLNSFGIVALGLQPAATSLPSPWQTCVSRTSIDATLFVPVNALGLGQYSTPLPPWPGLSVFGQVFALDPAPAVPFVDASNGVEFGNDF